MGNITKSIFRQKKVEKLYELKAISDSQRIGFSFTHSYCIRTEPNYDNVICDIKLGEYEIEKPPLEIGEEIFLHDIEKVVVIKNKLRSSDNTITYYVEDEVVETNNTKESYESCMNEVRNWGIDREEFERLEQVEREYLDYKLKYKYKNRFFNKKKK